MSARTPLEALPTPALLVDVERLERNVARMAAAIRSAGVDLRPHVKTSKMLEVVRRQRAAGAVGFTCATPGEVDALLADGVADLLWAHQPVGPAKVAFALDAQQRALAAGGRLRVALDSRAAAEPLAAAAQAAGAELPFLLEVDTGLKRAGVAPEAVAETARALAALPGLRLDGVMTHEGHVGAHVGDRAAIERAARAAAEAMAGAGQVLRQLGVVEPVVSVGSTPGATSAPFTPGVTEARPGTYVFYDSNQVAMESATWADCAVTVLARVVSRPRAGAAVLDAGLKAMSGDGAVAGRGYGRPLGLDAAFPAAFEEHGLLEGRGADALSVGDLVQVVPNHVCGAVNMWSQAHAVRDGEVIARWPIVGRR